MGDVPTLDVILPTYNRAPLVARALQSLFDARHPTGMLITVIVVDNRSTDDTHEVVARLAETSPFTIQYVYEGVQGLSAARNAGVRHATAELVGFIDDDERVDVAWFEVIREAFGDPLVDFIGGPYVGDWAVPVPDWMPADFPAVLGIVGDDINEPRPFGPEFPGILMGGNAVLRRRLFEELGPYDLRLGRGATGLASGEDHDLYLRLLKLGATGWFLPALRIFHLIPPERVTRSYFRSWLFWHGRSMGVMHRTHREPVPHLLGLPRYVLRKNLEHLGMVLGAWARLKGGSARAFTAELGLIEFGGYLRGRILG